MFLWCVHTAYIPTYLPTAFSSFAPKTRTYYKLILSLLSHWIYTKKKKKLLKYFILKHSSCRGYIISIIEKKYTATTELVYYIFRLHLKLCMMSYYLQHLSGIYMGFFFFKPFGDVWVKYDCTVKWFGRVAVAVVIRIYTIIINIH